MSIYLTEKEAEIFFKFLKERCRVNRAEFCRRIDRDYISVYRSIQRNTLKKNDARKFFKEIDFIFTNKK